MSCGQMREHNESKGAAGWEVLENEVGCPWAFYKSWPNPFKIVNGDFNLPNNKIFLPKQLKTF